MIRGVIFDMDGLLTDTEPVYYEIFNQILGEYGYSMTMQEYTQNICGRADMENFAYLIENYILKDDANGIMRNSGEKKDVQARL